MDVARKEPHHGWIEVIAGSMFSGKSEEPIRRLRRAQIAKQRVQIFKPVIDSRYREDHIVSHSDMRIASQAVRSSDELVKLVAADTEVVGIDEGTVLRSESAGAACNTLADAGKRVIVARTRSGTTWADRSSLLRRLFRSRCRLACGTSPSAPTRRSTAA
jgi:thymidine kinase